MTRANQVVNSSNPPTPPPPATLMNLHVHPPLVLK